MLKVTANAGGSYGEVAISGYLTVAQIEHTVVGNDEGTDQYEVTLDDRLHGTKTDVVTVPHLTTAFERATLALVAQAVKDGLSGEELAAEPFVQGMGIVREQVSKNPDGFFFKIMGKPATEDYNPSSGVSGSAGSE